MIAQCYGKKIPSPHSGRYDHSMTDFLRTALLLEEKAAKLPRDSEQRAYLLAMATAARRLGLELASPFFRYEYGKGSHQKRAHTWSRMALKMPDGSERSNLEAMAERAAICHIIERGGGDHNFDHYAYMVANYCFPES